ncbi:MAG: PepSY-associated TM helix domain-containing protein [Bryobacterales bacterium]|nr:PepSY-associated TM helix domain-containing protein [Bryobacterales bacterium]
MYRLVRNIHLVLGLFCALFLLMYAVSAVQMSHNAWFDMKPAVREARLPVDPAQATSPRALAAELMREHGLRGEIQSAREEEGVYQVRIFRPGTTVEARYTPGAGEAEVKTSRATFMGLLNRMHHHNGVYHESLLRKAWGWLVGLISLAILLLGASGVYLWFKTYNERRIGGAIFSLGLFVGLGLLLATRMQP